jgi:hypothetical protein
MKVTVRGAAAGVLLLTTLALAPITTTSVAQTPAKSLKDQLVGHWQLVSVTIGNRTPYGPDPQGSLFFDATGHYSLIVISTGNARNVAYFGTYTVNDADNSIVMHIDASSSSLSAAGRDEKRLVTLSGDELIVANQTPSGSPGAIKLTWKQAN